MSTVWQCGTCKRLNVAQLSECAYCTTLRPVASGHFPSYSSSASYSSPVQRASSSFSPLRHSPISYRPYHVEAPVGASPPPPHLGELDRQALLRELRAKDLEILRLRGRLRGAGADVDETAEMVNGATAKSNGHSPVTRGVGGVREEERNSRGGDEHPAPTTSSCAAHILVPALNPPLQHDQQVQTSVNSFSNGRTLTSSDASAQTDYIEVTPVAINSTLGCGGTTTEVTLDVLSLKKEVDSLRSKDAMKSKSHAVLEAAHKELKQHVMVLEKATTDMEGPLGAALDMLSKRFVQQA